MSYAILILMWAAFTYNAIFDRVGRVNGFLGPTTPFNRLISISGAIFLSYVLLQLMMGHTP